MSSMWARPPSIATNVVIQRSGRPVGLLCTDGFRDVLYYRDGYKRERFNLHVPRSQEFVEKTFSGLPAEQRRKIVHDTAAKLYGLN